MTTLSYYQQHAQEFFNQTIDVDMRSLYAPFLTQLSIHPQQSLSPQILDLGCGSGRDSLFFSKLGYAVTAVDGCKQLIDLAKKQDKHIDWQCLTFDQLSQQGWQHRFTGIWACASLLHVPFGKLASFINTLATMLVPQGVIYASFKYGQTEREKDGRFFCDLNEQRWQSIMQQLDGLNLIDMWQTTDKRVDRQEIWLNCLLRDSAIIV